MTRANFAPEYCPVPKSSNSESVCGVEVVGALETGSFFCAISGSNRFFNTRTSLAAKSSNPSSKSLPTNTDIPFSSCSGGSAISGDFEACNVRRQANAIRAHSPVALYPEIVEEAEEEDRLLRVAKFG